MYMKLFGFSFSVLFFFPFLKSVDFGMLAHLVFIYLLIKFV